MLDFPSIANFINENFVGIFAVATMVASAWGLYRVLNHVDPQDSDDE